MSTLTDNIAPLADGLFRAIGSATLAVFLFRLTHQKLLRTYWALAIFLALHAIESLVILKVPLTEAALVFKAFELLKLPLAFLLIWQLSRSIFAGYPAIGNFAAKSAKGTLAVCALLGILSFWLDPQLPAGRSPQLQLFISVERAVLSGLLAFTMALAIFSGWFAVRMAPNVNRLLVGWMLLLAAEWTGHLVANSNQQLTGRTNALVSIVLLITFLYWAVAVNRQGETDVSSPATQWDPVRMDHLTARLGQLESQLSRRGF